MKKKFKQLIAMLFAATIIVTSLPVIEAKAADYTYSYTSKEEAKAHALDADLASCKGANAWCIGGPAQSNVRTFPDTYNCEWGGNELRCKCANPIVLCRVNDTNEVIYSASTDTAYSHLNTCKAAWNWSISRGFVLMNPDTYECSWVGDELKCNAHGFVLCTRTEVPPSPTPTPTPVPKDELTPKAPACSHELVWEVTIKPTVEADGVEYLKCTKCGYVEMQQKISRDAVVYNAFANELEKQIKNAKPGDTLKLDFNAWHSVPQFLMERIISCGYDVELLYKYEGTKYDITIKNGCGQNLDIPWYGPLLMNSLYGN